MFDENGARDSDHTNGDTPGDYVIMYDSSNIGDIAPAGLLTIDRNGDTETGDATTNAVVSFQDNADTICVAESGNCSLADVNAADQPVTFTEAGSNTGVFINWDEALTTNILIAENAKRGTQAVFTYDDVEYGVLNNPTFGTIEYVTSDIGAEWNSGEVVTVRLFDPDMNYDTRSEDELKVKSDQTIVPAIKIGSPITLATLSSVVKHGNTEAAVTIDSSLNTQCSSDYESSTAASYESCYEKYSERSLMTVEEEPAALADEDTLLFLHSSDTTVKTLADLISGANGTAAYTYLQYDFRGLNGGDDSLTVKGNITFGDSGILQGGLGNVAYYGSTSGSEPTAASATVGLSYFNGLVGNTLINHPLYKLYGLTGTAGTGDTADSIDLGDPLRMLVKISAADTNIFSGTDLSTSMPISADVVSWGQSNNGVTSSDRHNNAIYRLEVEERPDNNSGAFEATVEYIMLNQLNVNNTATYNNTVPHGDEIEMIIHNDSTDEDEIRVSYLDLGSDGVETQISAQLAAPTTLRCCRV